MAFAASVDVSSRCRAQPLAQALKYEGCHRYRVHTIREHPAKIEHARYRLERSKDDHRPGDAWAPERVVPPQWRVSTAGAEG
jgi:hypothetical protein